MTKVYKWIRIGGLLSFIPIILAVGPLAGYFAADYLEKKLNLPGFTSPAFIVVGFIVSIRETVRIIRLALKAEKEIDGKHD